MLPVCSLSKFLNTRRQLTPNVRVTVTYGTLQIFLTLLCLNYEINVHVEFLFVTVKIDRHQNFHFFHTFLLLQMSHLPAVLYSPFNVRYEHFKLVVTLASYASCNYKSAWLWPNIGLHCILNEKSPC